MAQEPDRIRRDIEGTRAELTRDVDRLADRTSPKRVAQRQWTTVKEKVMGASDQVGDRAGQLSDRAGDAAHEMADSVRSTPRAVARQTEGNPLAVGVIAFGVGMLAATLIPVSDAEKRAGLQLKERSGELTDRVRETANDLKDDLSGSVREATEQVKETARDAARTTKDEATSATQDATDRTRQAARDAS